MCCICEAPARLSSLVSRLSSFVARRSSLVSCRSLLVSRRSSLVSRHLPLVVVIQLVVLSKLSFVLPSVLIQT